MLGLRQFFLGIKLKAVTALGLNSKGEMQVDETSGKLNYHNGTSASPVVTEAHSATLTNKTIDMSSNTVSNIVDSNISATAAIDVSKLGTGVIDNTEFSYLNGVSSNIQTQLNNTASSGALTAHTGASSGVHGVTGSVVGTSDAQSLSNKEFSDSLLLDQISTPADPASGKNRLYVKSDGALYLKDASGNEYKAGGSGISAWITGKSYIVDDFIYYTDEFIYRCAIAHTSGTFATDVSSGKFVKECSYDAHVSATSAHGVTGNIVGTSDSQALSNKTIDGDLNTVQDLALSTLKTNLTDASKFLVRDASGIVISNTKAVPTGDVVGTTDSQALSNKSIQTPTRLDMKQDTKSNLVTYASTAANGQLVFATDEKKTYQVIDNALVEVSSSSIINYISDPNFANGTSFWTSSSGSLVVSLDTTSKLVGANSMKIDKAASNLNGQYVYSNTFTIDNAYKASLLAVSLDGLFSDANYVDGYMQMKLYDVTNSAYIEPADANIYASTLVNHIAVNSQSSATGTQYQLRFIVNTTTTTAFNVYVDNISVGPATPRVKGAVVTDWKTYTPTFTPVTPASNNCYYRRVGDSIEINFRCSYTSNPGSGAVSITLPSGVTLDSSKMSATNDMGLGAAEFFKSGVRYSAIAIFGTTTSVYFLVPTSVVSSGLLDGSVINNGDSFGGILTLPVVGWSSNLVLSEDAPGRQIGVSMAMSSASSITTTPAKLTSTLDTSNIGDLTGAFDAANSRVKIQETGLYTITGMAYIYNFASSPTVNIFVYKNGVYLKEVLARWATASLTQQFAIQVYLKVNDYVELWASTQVGTADILSSNLSRWEITKINNPQTIAANAQSYAAYSTNAGLSVPGNGTVTTIVYEDAISDSNSAYNQTTGIYSCPRSGKLSLSATFKLAASTAWTALDELFIQLVIGGVTVAENKWVAIATQAGNFEAPTMQINVSGYPVTKTTSVAVTCRNISGSAIALSTTSANNLLTLTID